MLNVSYNAPNWLEELVDPVTLAPYEDVVTLNCGHNLGEQTVNELVEAAHKLHKQPQCPTCRAHLISAVPNFELRKLINQMQKSIAPALFQVQTERSLPKIPFAGERAKLRCASWKKWKDCQNASFIRKMEFLSLTANSFLDKVIVYGLLDGNINVNFKCKILPEITFSHNREVFKSYISRLGLLKIDESELSCWASLPRELDWALQFLTEINVVAEKYQQELPFIRRLLQEKQWPAVEQEMHPLQASQYSPATPASPAPQAESPPPAYVAPEPPPPAYGAKDEAEAPRPAHVASSPLPSTSSTPVAPLPSSVHSSVHVAQALPVLPPEQRLPRPPKPPRLPSRSPGRPVNGARAAAAPAPVFSSSSSSSSSSVSPSPVVPSASFPRTASPLPAGFSLTELMANRARVMQQPKADYRLREVREQKNAVEEPDG